MPKKILIGEQSLSSFSSTISNLGKKALIVTDESMIKLGHISKLEDLLLDNQIEYVIFDKINYEPTDNSIYEGAFMYKDTQCDFLIALGGGSPIDAMKAIAITVSSSEPLSSFTNKTFESNRPYMIAIPTTAGTGSETTQFTIITDTKRNIKMLLKGPNLIPDIAIIDPLFTISVPPHITAATGIDALCHAIESFTSKKAQHLSSLFALDAIKLIFEYLPLCYKEPTNLIAREKMSLASFEAGCAFNNSSVSLIHGMSRPIGANFHIAHGLSNAVLMYECLDYISNISHKKFAEIAKIISKNESLNEQELVDYFFSSLKNLLSELNIPTLKDIIDDKDKFNALIDKMSQDAIDSGSPSNLEKDISINDIKNIYKKLINS